MQAPIDLIAQSESHETRFGEIQMHSRDSNEQHTLFDPVLDKHSTILHKNTTAKMYNSSIQSNIQLSNCNKAPNGDDDED